MLWVGSFFFRYFADDVTGTGINNGKTNISETGLWARDRIFLYKLLSLPLADRFFTNNKAGLGINDDRMKDMGDGEIELDCWREIDYLCVSISLCLSPIVSSLTTKQVLGSMTIVRRMWEIE